METGLPGVSGVVVVQVYVEETRKLEQDRVQTLTPLGVEKLVLEIQLKKEAVQVCWKLNQLSYTLALLSTNKFVLC